MPLSAGILLGGRYRIIDPLGAGGMGEVYRARDTRLERDVAVKILPEHLAQNPSALARFEREAKALAALSHPNILAIHDFGTDNGVSYAVMELLKGETLRAQLLYGRLPYNKSLPIATAIADGLAAAHAGGIIHRDLKPENIFLTADGGIKILDFGLARMEVTSSKDHTSATTASIQTEHGAVMGTIPYMSPEQARGLPLDARTDIFSFGCVFFEMLSGTRAFPGASSADIIASILKEDPPELSMISPGLPPQIVQTVSRCLKKNPDERYQSTKDLAFALRMTVTGNAVPSTVQTRPRLPVKSMIRVLAVIAILLATVAVYRLMPQHKEIRSLAVLPFANGSGDPDAEYLSDGITESIISDLSQMQHLRVMARGTVFTYKGKENDPRKVGGDLNVEAVVMGRVIQHGDTLVVSADLVNVFDGAELWGKQYTRKMTDVISVQQEISHEIANGLRLKLTGEEEKILKKRYTENTAAYQLYLKARFFEVKFTPEGYQKSLEYYKQAIEKDPNYALAYAGMSGAYGGMTTEEILLPKEGCEKQKAAARKALDLDESLGEAHRQIASGKWICDWDWAGAEKEYRRAMDLTPETTHLRYSQFLRSLSRWDEAIAEGRKAQELDPLSIQANKTLGATYYYAGRYDEAIDQYRKTIEIDPNFAETHDLLADSYAKKGMFKEAVEEEEKYLKLVGDEDGAASFVQDYAARGYQQAKRLQFQRTLDYVNELAEEQYVSPMTFATIYANLDQKDEAFAWLQKAYEIRTPWLVYISTDPQFENLHSDSRFADLLRRIGVPK